MNWLVLSYFISLGTFQGSYAIQNDVYNYWQSPGTSFQTTLGAELTFAEHIFVYADVKTSEQQLTMISYGPFMSEYNVKVGVRFGGFEIGYWDNCIHPTLTQQKPQDSLFYGGFTSLYVKFSGHFTIF